MRTAPVRRDDAGHAQVPLTGHVGWLFSAQHSVPRMFTVCYFNTVAVLAVPRMTLRFSALFRLWSFVLPEGDPRMGNPSAQPGEEEMVARRLGKAHGS